MVCCGGQACVVPLPRPLQGCAQGSCGGRRSGCSACMQEVCLQAEVIASPEYSCVEEGVWQSGMKAKVFKARPSDACGDSVMSIEDAIEVACRYEAQARHRLERTPSTRSQSSSGGSLDTSESDLQAATPRGEGRAPRPALLADVHRQYADESAREESRRAQALEELLEARDKGRIECIEMACKSAETAGLARSEVASLRERFQHMCLTRIEEACRNAERAGVALAAVREARAQARGLRAEARRLQAASRLLEARGEGSAGSVREACRRAESAGLAAADVESLRRRLARLYATCIEEACSRAELAGVDPEDVREARAEAVGLRASAEPPLAKPGCFILSFSGKPGL